MQLNNIVKEYGKTRALDNATLRLFPGEVHALMGENGAGKSTMINVISGARIPDSGEILLNDEVVKFKNTRDSINNGIAVVYQELSLIPHLTVMENIAIINPEVSNKGRYNWKFSKEISKKALAILGDVAKEIDPKEMTSHLRTDQLQLVEIARAVSMGAKIILLDEPTSSLTFEETECLFGVIRELCKSGISFIFVSHRMNEIRQISNRLTVLRDGKTVLDGMPMDEVADKMMLEAMLGRKYSDELTKKTKALAGNENNEPVLKIRFKNSGKQCLLRKGEVVGVAGLSGSGRSALLKSIWGANKRNDVEFELYSKPFVPRSPKDSLKRDIAFIGEDRANSGLFLTLPSGETLMMPKRYYDGHQLIRRNEGQIVDEIIKKVNVKIESNDDPPASLSGGNQQKLLFGKWLTTEPKLFLLDEPTRGVDIHTKNDIYKLINGLTENGSACLVVTSEISELETLCHRVILMKDGQLDNILVGDDVNENKILAAITMADTEDLPGGNEHAH